MDSLGYQSSDGYETFDTSSGNLYFNIRNYFLF